MSTQLNHDQERGLTPRRCIEFALVETFGGAPEIIVNAAEVIELTLKKMGFKIVAMERADYDGR
jgi:PP-loop superfamily ATP-utilizing enzyme